MQVLSSAVVAAVAVAALLLGAESLEVSTAVRRQLWLCPLTVVVLSEVFAAVVTSLVDVSGSSCNVVPWQ